MEVDDDEVPEKAKHFCKVALSYNLNIFCDSVSHHQWHCPAPPLNVLSHVFLYFFTTKIFFCFDLAIMTESASSLALASLTKIEGKPNALTVRQ
jgi:hypothetical protein